MIVIYFKNQPKACCQIVIAALAMNSKKGFACYNYYCNAKHPKFAAIRLFINYDCKEFKEFKTWIKSKIPTYYSV